MFVAVWIRARSVRPGWRIGSVRRGPAGRVAATLSAGCRSAPSVAAPISARSDVYVCSASLRPTTLPSRSAARCARLLRVEQSVAGHQSVHEFLVVRGRNTAADDPTRMSAMCWGGHRPSEFATTDRRRNARTGPTPGRASATGQSATRRPTDAAGHVPGPSYVALLRGVRCKRYSSIHGSTVSMRASRRMPGMPCRTLYDSSVRWYMSGTPSASLSRVSSACSRL